VADRESKTSYSWIAVLQYYDTTFHAVFIYVKIKWGTWCRKWWYSTNSVIVEG